MDKPEAKTIVQNFRITPAFQSELASVARRQSKSVSVFIRECLENAIASLPKGQWLISRTK
jgi:hypothetical protein